MGAILSPDVDLDLSMEHCYQAISMEAFSVESILGVIKKYLPGLSRGFKGATGVLHDSNLSNIEDLPKDFRSAALVLRSVDYLTLEQFRVYVHEGFNSKLLDAVPFLNSIIDHMAFVTDLTTDYKTFLSGIISNKDSRISLNSHRDVYKRSETLVHDLGKEIAIHYTANSYNTIRTFHECFDRNSDAEKFYTEMQKVHARLNAVSIADIRKSVDLCAEYLDMFINSVKRGEIDNVSNEVIKDLATGSYRIAKEAEFIAANYYRVNIFISTAQRLAKDIKALKM